MSTLPCVEVSLGKQTADAAVIWLHGLGANGHDFEPIVPELRLPADWSVRFVFPHAPAIPVTINGGVVMPAWYDILSLDLGRHINEAQLLASVDHTRALIDREIERGIDSRRIVLAGFSQGGAVAYHAALTDPRPLAGLMALSSYLATGDSIEPEPVQAELPILVCHGSYDPVVPEMLGKQALPRLQRWGYQPEYRSYPMEHAVCMEEIRDISSWFQRVL